MSRHKMSRWWKGMENRIDTDIPITFPQGNDGAHSIASVDIMPGRKYFRPYFTPDADRCAVTIHGDRHERPAIVPALRTPLITPTISYPRYTILRNVPPRDLYLHTYLPVQTWRFILRLSNRARYDGLNFDLSTGEVETIFKEESKSSKLAPQNINPLLCRAYSTFSMQ